MSVKPLAFTTIDTPLGLTGLAQLSGKLVRVSLRVDGEKKFSDSLEEDYRQSAEKRPGEFRELIRQLNLYFKGQLRRFDYPLDLSIGTPFQQRVWKALVKIPYGQTRSYRWLAQAVKNPSACRAVGSANGRNPLPLIVPCHRVIRASGDPGGYTGGLDLKLFLLRLEDAPLGAP